MTVSTTSNRIVYTGNGSTTAFAFPYKFIATADLKVYLAGVLQTTGYTVGTPSDTGANVTFSAAPATGAAIVILSDPAALQATSLPSTGPFPAKSVETMADKLTLLVQRLGDLVARSFTLSDADISTASTTLPTPTANNIIGWNGTATGLQNVPLSQLATSIAYGTARSDVFTGDGTTKTFTLSANPGAQANLDVAIAGVTQLPGTDYTWTTGTSLVFSSAPPNGAKILARYLLGLAQGNSDSASASFIQAGAGAVATTAQDKLREWISPAGYGAKGDANTAGSSGTDDTAAFTLLETYHIGKVVNLDGKVYLVTTVPSKNTYINGSFVVPSATTDDQPVMRAFGRNALKSNTFIPRQFPSSTLTWAAGNYNTVFGDDSMVNNTTGRRNTVFGANSFYQNTSGFYNTVVGSWAAYNNTIGCYNTVIGNQSLQFNTTGNNNTVVGEGSLNASISGSNNVVIGDTAAVSVASGNRNIAIGSQALKKTNFALNDTIAIGYQALSWDVTGSLNLAIGNYTLGANTSGANNLAIGHQALANNSTASDNIGIGVQALVSCTTAHRNTAVGKAALSNIVAGTLQNTAVGYNALSGLTTGGNNTAVGSGAGSAVTTFDNTTAVGYNAQPTASNEVKLGDTNVQTVSMGNGLKIDIATILAAPAGTPLVVRVSGSIKYISV